MCDPPSAAERAQMIVDGMKDGADDARDAATRAHTAAAVAHAVAALITAANSKPDPVIRDAEKAAGALVSDNAEKAASTAAEAAEAAEAAADIGSEPPNIALVPEYGIDVAAARAAAAEARAAAAEARAAAAEARAAARRQKIQDSKPAVAATHQSR